MYLLRYHVSTTNNIITSRLSALLRTPIKREAKEGWIKASIYFGPLFRHVKQDTI